MKKRGMNLDKLIEVMDMIINEQPLPPERKNHPLHGGDAKRSCARPVVGGQKKRRLTNGRFHTIFKSRAQPKDRIQLRRANLKRRA